MLKPLLLVAALTAAAPALAKDPVWPPEQLGKETSIPFIAYRNLYTFETDGNRGVWLQDQRRHWYYATVLACPRLNFAIRIGVDTRFNGDQFDRTGTLLVDGERCPVTSLTASAGPPEKPKKHKKG